MTSTNDEPRRLEIPVTLSFDKDQETVGSDAEQCAAAIDMINMTLQREPYNLGARIEKIS